ncbi:MAG: hypothetical protein WCJ49_06505, partial [Deltaproteobacteria bacterium]
LVGCVSTQSSIMKTMPARPAPIVEIMLEPPQRPYEVTALLYVGGSNWVKFIPMVGMIAYACGADRKWDDIKKEFQEKGGAIGADAVIVDKEITGDYKGKVIIYK